MKALIDGLDDPVKRCREAAFWSLRQLLLDDKGWPEAFAAYRDGNDRMRQSVMQALVKGDGPGFYASEKHQREQFSMPPYGRLAAVILSGRDGAAADHHGWGWCLPDDRLGVTQL